MVRARIECPTCGAQGILNSNDIPCTLECNKCGNEYRITWNEEKTGTILLTNLSTGKQYEGWIPIGRY